METDKAFNTKFSYLEFNTKFQLKIGIPKLIFDHGWDGGWFDSFLHGAWHFLISKI